MATSTSSPSPPPSPSSLVEERARAASFEDLNAFLQRTSRTFALTIPMLPAPLRTQIGVAYLLFRIIDTFEDATSWAPAQRIEALVEFTQLLGEPDGLRAEASAARWLRAPPVAHAGYLELLAATPRVLEWYRQLAPPAREQTRRHVERSARGMGQFIERADAGGSLQLETMQDLRDYCYAVAGIVGEMLTELFLLSDQRLAGAASELRARAVPFGEGLQLVNILKDAGQDASEGRVYLPRQEVKAKVFMLARDDLRAAVEYTELLRTAGADHGLVTFNALNARLAIATLRLLRECGPGSKLTRSQVAGIVASVAHAVQSGAPLFDPAGAEMTSR